MGCGALLSVNQHLGCRADSHDLFDGIPLYVVEHGWDPGAKSAAATISKPDNGRVRSSSSFSRGLSLPFEQGGKNLHLRIQICY